VGLVDGENHGAVALVGLGREGSLDLGDEVGLVEAGRLPERRGQRRVQAPYSYLGVGEVDQGVTGGVEAVGGRAQGDGFPGPDFTGQGAEAAEPR
jgi:hypothetical protein